jgi:hypothetical protein
LLIPENDNEFTEALGDMNRRNLSFMGTENAEIKIFCIRFCGQNAEIYYRGNNPLHSTYVQCDSM